MIMPHLKVSLFGESGVDWIAIYLLLTCHLIDPRLCDLDHVNSVVVACPRPRHLAIEIIAIKNALLVKR